MKVWQVGILGLGHWYSAYNLARALREFPRATLVGAVWTHRTHLDEFARTSGVTAFDDYDALLAGRGWRFVAIVAVVPVPSCEAYGTTIPPAFEPPAQKTPFAFQ